MTYCLGMSLSDGLVMMADTRTNAGVDNVAVQRKLHLFEDLADDRVFAVASAGSLSTTQTAIGLLEDGVEHPLTGKHETLADAPSLRHAAQLAGAALRRARDVASEKFGDPGVSFSASLLFGGRVGDDPHGLFLVYNAGNVIEAGEDSPFLQVGELKYGKPILDRELRFGTDLATAIKIGLISFDGTIRSNLAVAAPIDIAVLSAGAHGFALKRRIEADDQYWTGINRQWADALEAACEAIAPPDWLKPAQPKKAAAA